MPKKLFTFFDRLEDKIRIKLSHWPITYALIGAIGIILLWKGVWDVADRVPGLQGFGAIGAGVLILLLTGLLVSFFIGDSVILSGLRRDKKLVDKTDKEILAAEKAGTAEILAKLDHLEQDVRNLKAD